MIKLEEGKFYENALGEKVKVIKIMTIGIPKKAIVTDVTETWVGYYHLNGKVYSYCSSNKDILKEIEVVSFDKDMKEIFED